MFISRLSNSKSDTFRQCPWRGYLRYFLYIPEGITPSERALKFGSYVHKILEDGYKDNTFPKYLQLIKEHRDEFKVKDSEIPKAITCIKNFMKFNDKLLSNEGGETVGVELNLTEELEPGMDYNGIIDRVEKGSDGGYLVIDYKTGREKTKVKLFSDPQLQGYAYLIHKKFNVPINRIVCAHYYPVSGKFIDLRYSSAQIEQWRRAKISEIWKIRKMKAEDFTCRENEFCNWCGYKETLCPKHTDPTKAKLLLEEAKIVAAEKKKERKLAKEETSKTDSPISFKT